MSSYFLHILTPADSNAAGYTHGLATMTECPPEHFERIPVGAAVCLVRAGIRQRYTLAAPIVAGAQQIVVEQQGHVYFDYDAQHCRRAPNAVLTLPLLPGQPLHYQTATQPAAPPVVLLPPLYRAAA